MFWQRNKEVDINNPPWLLRYRASTAFMTLTVTLGVLVDLAGYSLIVPVIPFRLRELGYEDVSSKTGWLVAAYAGGLIVSSPPMAFAGVYIKSRRLPLLVAILFMMGGVVLFMETHSFAAMAVARILQGVSGTGIWTLGLALVHDSVPEHRIGSVMGIVMIGFSVGTLIGPPIGGVLYARMGYRAPFVFALALLAFDFLLRVILIEKPDALKYVKAGLEIPGFEAANYRPNSNDLKKVGLGEADAVELSPTELEGQDAVKSTTSDMKPQENPEEKIKFTQQLDIMLRMMLNPRALVSFALSLLNGAAMGGTIDTAMILWLERHYGLTSLGAGLVYIGAVAPSFVVAPLAGIACDRWGAKWIGFTGILLAVPAYLLFIIESHLALFVFFLVIFGSSLSLFLTPVTQDLAIVVSSTPGLPSTAAFSVFNMSFSIGAFVGPIVAGQVIQAMGTRRGWVTLCAVSGAVSLLFAPVVALYMGGTWYPSFKRGKSVASQSK